MDIMTCFYVRLTQKTSTYHQIILVSGPKPLHAILIITNYFKLRSISGFDKCSFNISSSTIYALSTNWGINENIFLVVNHRLITEVIYY